MKTERQGTVEERIVPSKVLDEEVSIMIYLPADFSPLYKYSVLVAQDGRDYFTMGRIARAADELKENKQLENLIIVGVPYRDAEDRRAKYHPDGEKHEAYLRFLADELVPYLDAEFPTYQMGYTRALIGDSLAATVSLLAGLSYPHTFGRILLQSPYVNEDVLAAVQAFKQPHLLELYHVVGNEEHEVGTKKKDFVEPNRQLHQLFDAHGFQSFYDEFSGDHTWTHWQPDLKRALQVMFPPQ